MCNTTSIIKDDVDTEATKYEVMIVQHENKTNVYDARHFLLLTAACRRKLLRQNSDMKGVRGRLSESLFRTFLATLLLRYPNMSNILSRNKLLKSLPRLSHATRQLIILGLDR